MSVFRLPDGGYTRSAKEYREAWSVFAAPLESATGWRLAAFDPLLRFITTDGTSVTLTVEQLGSLNAALRMANEASVDPAHNVIVAGYAKLALEARAEADHLREQLSQIKELASNVGGSRGR